MKARPTVLLPLAVACVIASVLALACTDSTAPVLQVQPTSPTPGSGGTSRAASVQITSAPTTVEAGASALLACVVMDAHGVSLDNARTWHVSDTSVATVSVSGLFVARKLGTALVTCTSDVYSATVPVSVTQSPVDFVEVSPGAAPLTIGSSVQLVGVARDETGSPVADHPVQWSVDNSAVASVSPTGEVTARGEGTATITAASGGKTGAATLNVSTAVPAPVASVTLNVDSAKLNIGQTTNINAQLKDASGRHVSNRAITWSVSDPTIVAAATKDANTATAIGRATGSTTVTATSEGVSASVVINVNPPAVASVTVTTASTSIAAQQTTQAYATLSDAFGNTLTGRTVTWKSNNTSIATVSPTGLVTGISAGTVTIGASSEGKTGTATITVSAPRLPAKIAAVSVALASSTMTAGQQSQAYAFVTDSAGATVSGQTVTWSSSDPAIATVASNGMVTAVAPGSAKVRASVQSVTGDATETVTSTSMPVATVTTTLDASTLTVGKTSQATAVAKDLNGLVLTGKTVSWSSLNPGVATVSTSGLVTAVGTGTATIRATVDAQSGDASLAVSPPAVASVSASLAASSLAPGQTTQATAVAKDASGNALTGRAVTWSSTDPTVATVSPSGLVTAVAAGSVTIRAAADGVSGDAALSVVTNVVPVATLMVISASPLTVGQTTQATAVARDANGNVLTGRVVTWTSGNPAVATVSSTGLVTAVSAGQTSIQGKVENAVGVAAISVTASSAPVVPVAAVSVTLAGPALAVGQTTQATAVAKDANGNVLTGRVVSWSSANPAIATVSSSGLVTAVAAGQTSIQATVESIVSGATATVSAPSTTVGTVTVGITSMSLTAGQTTQATAVARDANGNLLTGMNVSWSSLSPSVASISAAGLVTAISAGTATIRATVGTKTGDATVVVAQTQTFTPSSEHPNEPAGMTRLLTHDGSSVLPNAAWDFQTGQTSVVSDPEKGNVLQLGMAPMTTPGAGTAAMAAGNAATNTWASAFAPTKFYMSWWEKLSPNFQGNNGAGGEKNIWMTFQSSYIVDQWLTGFDNLNTDPNSNNRPDFDLYNTVAANGGRYPAESFMASLPLQGTPGDPGNIFPRGSWGFFEILVTLNSRGNADGEIQMWLNGVAYPGTTRNTNAVWGLHVTGLQLASDVGARLTAIAFSNTWGGGGTALPADNYYRFKDVYVSGGYARAGERPDHWVLTLAPGATSTPAAGTSVELLAQLVDGNNNSVDVFGQNLQPSLHVVGPAMLSRHADPAGMPYKAENHGTVLIRVDVPAGSPSGQDISVSLDDYAKESNGSVNGFHRSSNTLHLTVK